MHYGAQNRAVRERVIAAEVRKLELRQARRRAEGADLRPAGRRELSTGRAL